MGTSCGRGRLSGRTSHVLPLIPPPRADPVSPSVYSQLGTLRPRAALCPGPSRQAELALSPQASPTSGPHAPHGEAWVQCGPIYSLSPGTLSLPRGTCISPHPRSQGDTAL